MHAILCGAEGSLRSENVIFKAERRPSHIRDARSVES
jgi:hypothetical protein